MALSGLLLAPLAAALLCWMPAGRRFAWQITVAAHAAMGGLALAVAARVLAAGQATGLYGWLDAGGLGTLVLLLVVFVGGLAAVFAGGYMPRLEAQGRRLAAFYSLFNLLVFSLLAVPALANPNLVWVAVEMVTLFTVLLVSYENTPAAFEAAWKFSVLTIMGAPIALFGFLALFWAYHGVGAGRPETWHTLRQAAAQMPPGPLRLAFVLVLVGFGAKAGLAPMHTWLPDAHSQAPTPVCAVLSGIKTTVPLYVILRLLGVVLASPQARLGSWLPALGLLSTGVGALLLLQVRDYKRMFAYSTVEHMGIILTAAGLASPRADWGAAFHLLNHALTKSLCFLVAGLVLLAVDTQEIRSVRGLLRVSPFAGGALILCSLAIAGAPPFPMFLSEFSILAAGFRAGYAPIMAALAVLILIAFVGILRHVNQMAFGRPAPSAPPPRRLPPSCRWAVAVAAAPVVFLGVYLPAPVHRLLQLAAAQLGGVLR